MLRPDQFNISSLRDVVGLALFLPVQRKEGAMLVASVEDRTSAVLLEGAQSFITFDTKESSGWFGLVIPNVDIEISCEVNLNADRQDAPLGSIVRTQGKVSVVGRSDSGFREELLVPLKDNLHGDTSGHSVAFGEWAVVLGRGKDRAVLRSITVQTPS